MPIDWHRFHADSTLTPAVVDSRRRLRICLAAFVLLLLVVFGRTVQLEVTQGAAFRELATRPLQRRNRLPGVRGRILARDGTVLARDREILALAVHYRWLQQPADARWLREKARSRLQPHERKDEGLIAAEQHRLLARRRDLARRLALLCNVSPEEWNRRARRIRARVERIADSVARRRGMRITVAEQIDYHVMAEGVPIEVVAEIEGRPQQYLGVKTLTRTRRAYPAGSLAANLLGHLGRVTREELEAERSGYHADDFVGRMGLERQYESLLRGTDGVAVELTDHGGNVLSTHRKREPGIGRDLVLTIDAQLQRAAETLLDGALERRTVALQNPRPAGGAIVVMDAGSGRLLAAATAPRFDPNLFVAGRNDELAAVMAGQSHPLFDRACRMAIAPGSVFKTVWAAALLESAALDPGEPFHCRGYLHEPGRLRCAVYLRRSVGHGDVTLGHALAVSCNVYFFHHAGRLGPEPLVDWAQRFGLGRPTGVDLPAEAAGAIPTPATIQQIEGHDWRPGDTYSLAIGQGSVTATPLQVARLMAAVANGGKLVTPHLVSRLGLPELADGQSAPGDDPIRIPLPRAVPGLHEETLATIRAGLERVVADPQGTAYGAIRVESVAVAGKTGTAETTADRAPHAWFAGYAPAAEPKFALVVALEHAGDAASTAAAVAGRLVRRMEELGML